MQCHITTAVVALHEMRHCGSCVDSVLVPPLLCVHTYSLLTLDVCCLLALRYYARYAALPQVTEATIENLFRDFGPLVSTMLHIAYDDMLSCYPLKVLCKASCWL
jgi:hypothetical protein